jgi:SAM-dependent methyltransferase
MRQRLNNLKPISFVAGLLCGIFLVFLLPGRTTHTYHIVAQPAPQPAPQIHQIQRPSIRCSTVRCEAGDCLLGKCFCRPGVAGERCEVPSQPPKACSADWDHCFYHPDYGVAVVSRERWLRAQAGEQQNWAGLTGQGDRVQDHLLGFKKYEAVPDALGDMLELGCGPWTQSKYMFEQRTSFQIRSLTLWDPSLLNYVVNVPSVAYKNGTLGGQPVVLVNAGAENLSNLRSAYDTIMIINVMEHVENAYAILESIYQALRPGGILIFNDRWWDMYPIDGVPNTGADRLLHPIRLKRAVFEWFFHGFDVLLDHRDTPAISKYMATEESPTEGTYFIGRKKKSSA